MRDWPQGTLAAAEGRLKQLGRHRAGRLYRWLLELDLSLKEMNKNLFHLRFQSATDRLETPSEINKAKKEIARIRTIQRERALGLRGQKNTEVTPG